MGTPMRIEGTPIRIDLRHAGILDPDLLLQQRELLPQSIIFDFQANAFSTDFCARLICR